MLTKRISDLKTLRPGIAPEYLKEMYLRTRGWNSDRRALPNFLVIGAQKSGSTSLFNYLSLHPKVIPSVQKEIFYFNRYYDRGEQWYRRFFPVESSLRRQQRITGEASTTYLCSAQVPPRVARQLPDVRCIAVLRHPADRAVSHFYHRVRAGRERRQLTEVFTMEMIDRWCTGAPVPEEDRLYLDRGCYAQQLQIWYESIPQERLFVLKAEEMFSNLNHTLSRVQDFLGLARVGPQHDRVFNAGGKAEQEQAEIHERLCHAYQQEMTEVSRMTSGEIQWKND